MASFEYGDDGKLKSFEEIDKKLGITDTSSVSYDANGLRTGKLWDEFSDGSIDRSETYAYDADGNVKSITRFDGAGQILEKDTFTYKRQPVPAFNLINFQLFYFR